MTRPNRSIHGTPASIARLRKRHAAEFRLKSCGILALALAFLALAALLWSIFGKATPALTESYIILPVDLAAAGIDPDKTAGPALVGTADFAEITKNMMQATFPDATSRADRKNLAELISSGAVFELRDHVLANPGLAGTKVEFAFLASDSTDLYLKGESGVFAAMPKSGTLRLGQTGDEITLKSDADDFAAALAEVRKGLLVQANDLRVKAALQEKGRVEFERQAAAANGAAQAKAATEAAKRAGKRDALLAEAGELAARAASAEGFENLTEDTASLAVKLGASWIKLTRISANEAVGVRVGPAATSPAYAPAEWNLLANFQPESARNISDRQIIRIEMLKERGAVETNFNWRFFTAGDSREPELAGIWGAAVGSFWTMLVTFLTAFPIGVLAAIYLEEFAPRNRKTDFIEVNINNLAAVPSIIYGLLGLAVFIGFFGIPRSAPLAGGIVLALMTLPTIIIASRTAVRAVPPSIRDAALGVGASKLQTSFHHVLPLAMPGILTGTIIGMARALGETAPLIMIGMVAFIVDIPSGITDSATVLPVQVYRWSDFPERAFEARTAAAICVLLVFLVVMNALAVFLRNRFERRW